MGCVGGWVGGWVVVRVLGAAEQGQFFLKRERDGILRYIRTYEVKRTRYNTFCYSLNPVTLSGPSY